MAVALFSLFLFGAVLVTLKFHVCTALLYVDFFYLLTNVQLTKIQIHHKQDIIIHQFHHKWNKKMPRRRSTTPNSNKKKQSSIKAFASASKSRSTPRAKTNTHSNRNDYVNMPQTRTWIYSTTSTSLIDDNDANETSFIEEETLGGYPKRKSTTTTTNSNSNISPSGSTENGYELYLNTRVQRPIVRSLPCNYSYFTSSNDNVAAAPSAAAASGGGEGVTINNTSSNDGEGGDGVATSASAAAALNTEEGATGTTSGNNTPINNNNNDNFSDDEIVDEVSVF